MDCPHRIPPSGISANCHRSHSQHRYPNRSTNTIITKTDTNAVDPDNNHTIEDTTAIVAIIPKEAILCHTIGTTDNITEVVHDTQTQILISNILAATLHIEGHLYIGAHQLTHGITADHALNQPTGQLRKPYIRIH